MEGVDDIRGGFHDPLEAEVVFATGPWGFAAVVETGRAAGYSRLFRIAGRLGHHVGLASRMGEQAAFGNTLNSAPEKGEFLLLQLLRVRKPSRTKARGQAGRR